MVTPQQHYNATNEALLYLVRETVLELLLPCKIRSYQRRRLSRNGALRALDREKASTVVVDDDVMLNIFLTWSRRRSLGDRGRSLKGTQKVVVDRAGGRVASVPTVTQRTTIFYSLY